MEKLDDTKKIVQSFLSLNSLDTLTLLEISDEDLLKIRSSLCNALRKVEDHIYGREQAKLINDYNHS